MLVYTVEEAARRCNVPPRVVEDWFDSGELRGYRIPRGDRRIPREYLVEFLKERGLPGLEDEARE